MSSRSTVRRTRGRCPKRLCGLALAAVMTAAPGQTAGPPAVRPRWDSHVWQPARGGFTLAFDRAAPPDGRLAVFVDNIEVTALLEASTSGVTYPTTAPPLPAGERRVKAFLIEPDGTWTAVADVPLRILSRNGFQVAEVKPTADLAGHARLDSSFVPAAQAPPEEEPRAGTLQLALATRHVREGVTLSTRVSVLGATRQEEALRFSQRGAGAPQLDLASYLIAVETRALKLAVGHVSLDGQRHLAAGLRGRGVAASLSLGDALALRTAALSGSEIVGWSNPLGLARSQHRLATAVLAVEAFPHRPGQLRLEASILEGSVEPTPSFTQGAVLSAEESSGFALRVLASTPSQRVNLDAGWASSTFRPAFDGELEGGLTVTPLAAARRQARYADAGVILLSGAPSGGDSTVDLRLGLHHERVEPLYRSLGARAAADLESNAADMTANIGAVSLQVAARENSDNLERLASVLSTTSRQWNAAAQLPLAALLASPSPAWPALTLSYDRIHQFGRGLPVNGEFDPSHVPDQVSRNAAGGLEWQGSDWRVGLQRNWTHQDNRQPGRVNADFETFVDSFSSSWAATDHLDAGVELSQERSQALEQNRTDRTRRPAVNISWRLSPSQTILGNLARTVSCDSLGNSENTGFDGDAQWSLSFRLSPLGLPQGRGTVFARYSQRRLDAREPLFELNTATGQWAIHTGFNLSLF